MNNNAQPELLIEICQELAEVKGKYDKLVGFLTEEIRQRKHVCTTNHAVLLDRAKELLREIGESE
jgi:hypothetical protein